MTATRGVAIVVLVAVVGLAIAPIASAGLSDVLTESAESVVADHASDEGNERTPDDNGEASDAGGERADAESDNNSSMGTNVSEFTQSSAVETETTVETALFNANYENAANESRDAIVTDRADTIDDRIASLEAERAELQENEGNMSSAAYDARMTRLAVEISSLEESIDAVEQRADETGVDTGGLEELRSNAAELNGPEVAEVATGLAGVDLSDRSPEAADERVSESTTAEDSSELDDVDSGNLTDESGLPVDGIVNGESTDDTFGDDNGSGLKDESDEDEILEIQSDEREGDDGEDVEREGDDGENDESEGDEAENDAQ